MTATAILPSVEPARSGADVSDYVAIHGVIRRTTRALRLVTSRHPTVDERQARALRRYWEGFAAELYMHHTVEDDIFFPALVERDPSVRGEIVRVDADHAELDHLITAGNDAFGALEAGSGTIEAHRVMVRLDQLMTEHLDYEDTDLVPRFAAHFDQPEYEALHQQAISQPMTRRQLAFVVPYMALWIDPVAWRRLWATAPLPLRVMYQLTRRSHARLARAAFGDVLEEVRP